MRLGLKLVAANGSQAVTVPAGRTLVVGRSSACDVPIRDLVGLICKVVGYQGGIRFDTSRPDGAPRKMVDTSLAASIGWRAQTPLQAGLEATYRWYVDHASAEKQRAVA